jgi:hypothetical protein
MNDNERRNKIENIYNKLQLINDEIYNIKEKNDENIYSKKNRKNFEDIKKEIEYIKKQKPIQAQTSQTTLKKQTQTSQTTQPQKPIQTQPQTQKQVGKQIIQVSNKEKEVTVKQSTSSNFMDDVVFPMVGGGVFLVFTLGFMLLTGYDTKGRKIVNK